MNNPFKRHIPNNHSWYIILLMLMLALLFFFAFTSGEKEDVLTIQPVQENKVEEVKTLISGAKGYTMRVTAFSDVECGSAWCNRHEPKNGQVALNFRKFGRWAKVYIPAFDKFYNVVGNTDGRTDLDIWFSEDQESALKFGSKNLLVNLVN